MVSYLKFKVATLPAGASVQKVELKLTRDPSTPLPSTVKVKKVADHLVDRGRAHRKNAPATGADVASANPAATAAAVTFNLTGSVTKAGTYTFAVTSPATNAIARFRSTEQGAAGPQLTLTLKTATHADRPRAGGHRADARPPPTGPTRRLHRRREARADLQRAVGRGRRRVQRDPARPGAARVGGEERPDRVDLPHVPQGRRDVPDQGRDRHGERGRQAADPVHQLEGRLRHQVGQGRGR